MRTMNILAVTIGGLGDAVLFSPVLMALRKRFPEEHIQLLVASRLAASAYAGASGIDRIDCLDVNNRSWVGLGMRLLQFGLQSRWRSGGYDLGIYATGLNPNLTKVLKVLAGVRKTVCGPKPPDYGTDLECNVALARRFEPETSTADAFVPISEAAEREAIRILQANGIRKDDCLLTVYPSTDLAHRPRWALSNLVEVIRRIKQQGFHGKIIVLGSHAEGHDWSAVDSEKVADANLSGRLSISGSAAVLKRSCLTVGNDGGLMHVAGAVGSPAVVVMANAPLSYRPPGVRTIVIHSEMDCCNAVYPKRPTECDEARCLQSISADDVYRACAENLATAAAAGPREPI